jgi:hypothetical protein
MANAYPASTFVGFDYHESSVDAARKRAADAGLADRVTFEVASAQDFPGSGYDLVAFFDCLHDMGDPVGAAGRFHGALAIDGTWMVVEPYANGTLVASNCAAGGSDASDVSLTPMSFHVTSFTNPRRLVESVTGKGSADTQMSSRKAQAVAKKATAALIRR